MSTEEKAYMATSLDFINNHKENFTPVLSNIASDLNTEQNKDLIEAMNIMKTKHDSNLKELITKLTENKKFGPHSYSEIDHEANFANYVEQCLRIIGITASKKIIYELFNLFMQDLNLKENEELRAKVNNFKKNNKEWKKMVGMLIPPGAQVKILTEIVEPSTQFAIGKHGNKSTPLTSRELIGTVVTRGKLGGVLRNGDFKKVVRLPKHILRKFTLDYIDPKNELMEFDPEDIQLRDLQPKPGKDEPEPPALKLDDIIAQVKGGGQQRTTRKHKSSIIGSARKTRTYR